MKLLCRFFLAFLLISIPQVFAAEPNVTIRLRPYCQEGIAICPEFTQYDAESMITHGLQAGDTLDVQLVLTNPSGQAIQSVQSWLAYDPLVLQGQEVRVSPDFPLVAPGEQNFVPEQGIVKIGASNVSGGMNAAEFVLARIQFQVLSPGADLVPLRFHEFSLLGQEGKTKALIIEGGRTVNVLKTRPHDLLLYFGQDPPPSLVPVQQTPTPTPLPTPTPTQAPTPTPVPSDGFSRLQPTGLRVMTENDKVYLVWNPLSDPPIQHAQGKRVIGYNIYYGTVSGRYIQRRTVSSGNVGVTVRGLPIGKRYYFALTAFSDKQQETEFSYEVAVVIGDSASSTAPFTLSTGGVSGPPVGGSLLTPKIGRVPGGTGLPVFALLGIVVTSLMSTLFFFRKRILT